MLSKSLQSLQKSQRDSAIDSPLSSPTRSSPAMRKLNKQSGKTGATSSSSSGIVSANFSDDSVSPAVSRRSNNSSFANTQDKDVNSEDTIPEEVRREEETVDEKQMPENDEGFVSPPLRSNSPPVPALQKCKKIFSILF